MADNKNEKELQDVNVDGYAFNVNYARGKKWEDFFAHYKESAYTHYPADVQEKKLRVAFDVINPAPAKTPPPPPPPAK